MGAKTEWSRNKKHIMHEDEVEQKDFD